MMHTSYKYKKLEMNYRFILSYRVCHYIQVYLLDYLLLLILCGAVNVCSAKCACILCVWVKECNRTLYFFFWLAFASLLHRSVTLRVDRRWSLCYFNSFLSALAAVNMLFSTSLCDCNPNGNKLPSLLMCIVKLKDMLYYVNVVVGVRIDSTCDIIVLCCIVYDKKYHLIWHTYLITNRWCNTILIPVSKDILASFFPF